MIAYLILVHRYPEQLKRMFKAIFDPSNYYLIHVDKNSGHQITADVRAFLRDYPNASMLESEKAQWGGYSLVNIEVRGMARLLQINKEWTHFINLSGQDFPLKTQGFIRKFLTEMTETFHYPIRNGYLARVAWCQGESQPGYKPV